MFSLSCVMSNQREDEVKSKFRSYDDLKKDFSAMNMDIETDAEIVTGLVKKLQDKATPRDRLLTVLKDLEYYLHQVSYRIRPRPGTVC